MTLHEWLEIGIALGFCSRWSCSTHDGLASTPAEDAAWDAGDDPCVPAVRLWPEGRPDDAIEARP